MVIYLQSLVPLWNRVRSFVVFNVQRKIQKNEFGHAFAIIADPTGNNRKRRFCWPPLMLTPPA